jgi:hypothetical protein
MDIISHEPGCEALDDGTVPRLTTSFTPSTNLDSIRVEIWEQCPVCMRSISYASGRMPMRRFHREWKASLATWLATWEHRHNIWDRVTGGS